MIIYNLKLTTNLKCFHLDYIKKNFTILNNKLIIKASYHPEYADPDMHLLKRF